MRKPMVSSDCSSSIKNRRRLKNPLTTSLSVNMLSLTRIERDRRSRCLTSQHR